MNINLSGKTALVTGSAGGIGFAIAEGLARAGASVVLNGLTDDEVGQALAKLKDKVPAAQVTGVAANLGSAAGTATLLEAVPSVDILVNNVGIYGPQDFFETPDDVWTRFFDVNVMSGIRLARAYGLGMVAKGWGRILFISSESALNVPADMIHYGMTKTANLSVSRGLAKRLAGTGVTVNAILPGPTLSEGLQSLLKDEQAASGLPMDEVAAKFVAKNRPGSLLRRAASVDEVANLVVYAASPQASATTGAALRVDGGVVDTIA
ncbi:SDR family oxidoreductase [Ottowia sp.]|uniref:SDR family NAD(P)-dependent oxidoreductase n=1 Tax=Ottowia sp. TaxID=1898956 RepID=UPI0025EF0B1C|nr:SDR family oxidoreductase [Ottowia sp.]MBK6745277.1 SDR family oxidoreductase [Ottowia sp.]